MTRKEALEFLFQYLYISHASEQIPPLNGYTVEREFLLHSKDYGFQTGITAVLRHTAIHSIAVRTFIFEGKLHSKWSVLGTGMTREGGYLHDTILFSGSQLSEHWDDILPSGDCSQITMFVQ